MVMDQILDFFKKLFDMSDWPPRWHCGKWTDFHGWLYIISDLAIWSAYFAMPIVIIRYVSRKKNIAFTRLYFLFAAFILACGATHFLDAVAFWLPAYRLSALVRFITGVISWVTVFSLVKHLPVLFSLRSQSALEAEIEERKRTEQALKKSKKDYDLLIGSVKDYAIFMLDTEGNVTSWNSGAENIKGYKWAEIIGRSFNVFYTPEQLQLGTPAQNLKQALLHGRFETQGWRVRKDGTLFWADVVFTALYDEDRRFYGYAKITRDITEKRKAEERILLLANIASNIQDPVIATNNNGLITRWNKAAELLLEWKAEEVLAKAGTEILKIDYLQTTREQVIESYNEKKYWQGEVVYHTRSGKPVNVLVTVSQLTDAEGHVTGNLALVRDITERKKAEVKMQEFEHFFNNSNDFSCIANTEGYFEVVNKSFNTILGYAQNELASKPFLDFVHPDDVEKTRQAYEKLKDGETVIHFINRYRRNDGSYSWFDWNATPNPVTGKLYCIARDITDRKKAEDALNKSNEELEAFSYSVSHDLRAPLRGIIGFANILEEDYASKLDDEARRITGVIKNNTIKMGKLIDDLLSFSRLGRHPITKTAVNSNDIIRELINEQPVTDNHPVNWIIPVLPVIKADPNTIKQVWANLLSNAIKYSGKNHHPVVEIGSYPGEYETIFFVKDNGVGFDTRYKEKLFKVFQRLHSNAEFEGTGVGLAIVEKIIIKHGGRVWAEAAVDEGACFYFSLPNEEITNQQINPIV